MQIKLTKPLNLHIECLLLSMLFAGFLIFGHEIKQNGFCDYSMRAWFSRILFLILFTTTFYTVCVLLFRGLSMLRTQTHCPKYKPFTTHLHKHPFRYALIAGIIILLCWLPVFLAFYPGIYAYDTPNQTWQIYAGEYNTHHPLFHTLLMGKLVMLGKDLLSYNFGIALYTCVQMLILSLVFAGCLYYLLHWKCPGWLFVVSTLFLGLHPTCSLFAINATKDTLFSGFFALTGFVLVDLIRSSRHNEKCTWSLLAYIFSAVMACLFRNNGIYTLLFAIPFLLLIPKPRKWYVLLATVGAITIFSMVNHSFETKLQPTKGSVAEMLSIPIQQFGRMVYLHGDELSESDYELLHTYIAEDKLTLYNPGLSDPIKDGFQSDAFHHNTKHFIQTWFSFFKRYPGTFLDAFLRSSLGNWYPGSDFDGYVEMTVKDMWGKIPEMHRNSKLPALEQRYQNFFEGRGYQTNLLYRFVTNPVLAIWLLFIVCVWLIYRRNYVLLPAMMPFIGLWGTLLLGPVALVRYMLPFFFSIPLFISLFLDQSQE